MRISLWHFGMLSLFILLSLGDLFLTGHLLEQGDGRVYEGNPIANAWLSRYGWTGLVIFKGLAIGLVAVVILFISRSRPRVGGGLLTFGCTVLSAVMLYSCFVSRFVNDDRCDDCPDYRGAADAEEALRRLDARKRSLENERRGCVAYHALLEAVSKGLIDQEYTLDEAVAQLESAEKSKNPAWRNLLRKFYPGCNDRECLAAHLVYYTLQSLNQAPPSVEERITRRLHAEYRSIYGIAIPPILNVVEIRRQKDPSTARHY
jgi:hypothetical protein